MNVSQICGLICVIIVILLIVSYLYFSWVRKNAIPSFSVKNGILAKCKHKNLFHPIYKPTFEDEKDYIEINANTALVIRGDIPREYFYWGITACSPTGDAISDSVSSRSTRALSLNSKIAVVLLSNQKVYDRVCKDIIRTFPDRKTYVFYPIYVNPGFYNLKVEYSSEKANCDFGTLLYNFPSIKMKKPGELFLTDRDCAPKESDRTPLNFWHEAAHKALKEQSLKFIREIGVSHSDTDNRDFTIFESEEICLEKDEYIFVMAVDHVVSNRSSYSRLFFENAENSYTYASYLTGIVHDVKIERDKTKGHIVVHRPDAKDDLDRFHDYTPYKRIKIKEYIGPEPMSNIGPGVTSVIPMKIFIVKY